MPVINEYTVRKKSDSGGGAILAAEASSRNLGIDLLPNPAVLV